MECFERITLPQEKQLGRSPPSLTHISGKVDGAHGQKSFAQMWLVCQMWPYLEKKDLASGIYDPITILLD